MNINKFGAFISYLTGLSGNSMDSYQVETVAGYVGQLIDELPANKVSCDSVDELLSNMGREGKKIEAIKAYRILTGTGLKEAKDAIEKYWIAQP